MDIAGTPFGPFVSPSRLADSLDDPDLIVIDASLLLDASSEKPQFRSGRAGFVEAHIPGARFADLAWDFSAPEGTQPFARPVTLDFLASARAIGLRDTSTIVVYDTVSGQWASHLRWLLRSYGVERVAVLDGGFRAWRDLGLPLERGESPMPEWGDVHISDHGDRYVGRHDVAEIVAGLRESVLVCALSPREFSGELTVLDRPGHIPGSLNVPLEAIVRADDNRMVSHAELETLLGPIRDTGLPIVTYCGGGVAATAVATALESIGARSVAVYQGSLLDWLQDPRLPLAVSPAAPPSG